MIAKEISDGWADQTTLSPDAINDLLGMLYEKHPTIPNDKTLVQILNTNLGHFLVRAEPETRQIHIGPLTDEQAASLAGRVAELGVPATELYPEMDRQWAVQMDARITEAWERGDDRMPSENRVKKLVDDLVKRYREQLHEREFNVSPDGAAMALLTHRSERDSDDSIRLYLTLHPKVRAVKIAALMTPEAEAECQAYMDDESDGDVALIPASAQPIDPATLRTTFHRTH
jgi:hypothetical protein